MHGKAGNFFFPKQMDLHHANTGHAVWGVFKNFLECIKKNFIVYKGLIREELMKNSLS